MEDVRFFAEREQRKDEDFRAQAGDISCQKISYSFEVIRYILTTRMN